MHELANLNVGSTDDKVKAKAQAKHANLRKRKALADLFKYLQLFGKLFSLIKKQTCNSP